MGREGFTKADILQVIERMKHGPKRDAWQLATESLESYPLGTKARAIGGGYWIKVERGWKWCTGATFPKPGGDWDGTVSLPDGSII